MNRLTFGIADFIAELKEQKTTVKGDVPGHEFHGNQYSAGGGGSGGNESSGGESSTASGGDLSSMSQSELESHVAGLAQKVDQKKQKYFDADRKATRANAVRVTPEGRELNKIAEAALEEYNAAYSEYQKASNLTELGKKRLEAMGEYTRTHSIPAVQQGRFSTTR